MNDDKQFADNVKFVDAELIRLQFDNEQLRRRLAIVLSFGENTPVSAVVLAESEADTVRAYNAQLEFERDRLEAMVRELEQSLDVESQCHASMNIRIQSAEAKMAQFRALLHHKHDPLHWGNENHWKSSCEVCAALFSTPSPALVPPEL